MLASIFGDFFKKNKLLLVVFLVYSHVKKMQLYEMGGGTVAAPVVCCIWGLAE